MNRILIYRLGSLGDTVVSLPCLHLIERTFPASERMLLTNVPVNAKAPAAAAVLGESGLVQKYLSYPVGTRNPVELARLWWQIRSFRPDLLVYLMPVRPQWAVERDVRFFEVCGIRRERMVGVPGPGNDFAETRYIAETDLYEPEARRLARSVATLGPVDLDDRANWDLRLTAGERAKAEQLLAMLRGKPFICMGIGCKQQPNEWGLENWVSLVGRLATDFEGHALVMVGSTDEIGPSAEAARHWRGSFLNLCGQLSPRETAAVMARAELFVGPDSGPGHLAAAVGTPCAGVFSARNRPGEWFPYGAGNRVVYHKTDCFNCRKTECIEQRKKCILSITPEEAHAAAVEAWQVVAAHD